MNAFKNQEIPDKDQRLAARNLRTALVLAAIAFAVFVGFIFQHGSLGR